METNKPIETIRHGSIKAAIWANKSDKAENGEFYTVTFARVYRDGDALTILELTQDQRERVRSRD